MKHPEKVLRDYKKSDDEMLQQSDSKLASFIKNKSLFVKRFPQLADPYANNWADAISTARNIDPDYASVANQTTESDELEKLMDDGRNLFQMLMLYAQLAFPGHVLALRAMGQSQYESASRNPLKLAKLLRTAGKEASKDKYKPALLNKGMTEEEISSLETMADKIIDQSSAVDNAKKDRSFDADERITMLNAVWEKTTLVCNCAKLLFQKDAARYALFLLTDGDTSPQQNDDQSLKDKA